MGSSVEYGMSNKRGLSPLTGMLYSKQACFRDGKMSPTGREAGKRIPSCHQFTLARCVCRLFLASAVSDMRFEKAMLTLLNWFHISLDVEFSRISISSLSLREAARSLWECRMLSSVNLDHESGRESLKEGKE